MITQMKEESMMRHAYLLHQFGHFFLLDARIQTSARAAPLSNESSKKVENRKHDQDQATRKRGRKKANQGSSHKPDIL